MSAEAKPQATPVDEFADGVVPPEPSVAERVARKLEPWHKPRKQMVRHGWRENVKRLMGDLELPIGGQRLLRYFTLPAPEMLDIRVLEEVAKHREYQIQYIGMTKAQGGSNDDQQLQLGQTMLRAQPDWVHSTSTVLYYKLEDLVAGEKPVARKKLSEFAPFHVINLDLCDYLLAPGLNAKLLEALERIVEIQTSRPGGDWLLFLATRFGGAQTCPDKFQRIRKAIEDNCASSLEFKTGLEELLKVAAGESAALLRDPCSLSQAQLRDVLGVGLTKWLGAKLLQANPPFELDMMTTYVYAVDGGEQDMLSFVYRCRYRGTAAPMANSVVEAADAAEKKIASRALKKTRELVDVDAELHRDQVKLQSLSDETKALLKQANYSDAVLAGYDEWAQTEAAKVQAA